MTTIFRYLLKHQFAAFVTITLVLATAIWFSQSLKLLETVINGGAPIYLFFELMGLVLPGFLPSILPIALFIALLFSYQRLLADSELVVMTSAGYSPWQLTKPALCLAIVATLFHLALNVDLVPRAFREMRVERNFIKTQYAGAILRDGSFNTVNAHLTIYVKEREGRNFLRGILIHDTRNAATAITLTAEQGYLIDDAQGPRLIIQNGTRQERDIATGHINWLQFKQYVVDLMFYNNGDNTNDTIKSNERPMSELFHPPPEMQTPKLLAAFRAEAHNRLASPLYNIAFALAAILTIIGGDFNRRGRLQRTLSAVGLMVLIQISAMSLAKLADKNSNLLPVLYIFPLLIVAVTIFGIHQQTGFKLWRARS